MLIIKIKLIKIDAIVMTNILLMRQIHTSFLLRIAVSLLRVMWEPGRLPSTRSFWPIHHVM